MQTDDIEGLVIAQELRSSTGQRWRVKARIAPHLVELRQIRDVPGVARTAILSPGCCSRFTVETTPDQAQQRIEETLQLFAAKGG